MIDGLRKLPEALLFDLDGTLYRGDERVPGADRLVRALEERGVRCWFVTNNSSRTPEEVALHLEAMGIPATPDQVVTSATAAADYVRRTYPEAGVYVIGERGLKMAMAEAVAFVANESGEAAGAEAPDRKVDIVVQGIDREFTYERMTTAVRHILNGAAYIQTNPDRLLPVSGGFLPGAGSLGAAIEAATGVKPIVIGKPSPIIMDYALRLAGAAAERAWVIGDNPHTDLAAARDSGCPSILVLTGLCSRDDWRSRCEAADVTPDAVCAGPDELAELLLPLLDGADQAL
ncbi:HAD-IIA family hydrolase [Cohnella faecalis]|uniref:Acid sugar phosphatase n=1 Tax=Cohnella faecalis TaxID=2315694 RepID=A0A398CN45_9BACL|nr:HAD-IIA family hydrolase [Cohnella faecalis]RIE04776.1 HAD-IIA family hydrolase [Cohnella faecalis]